MVLLTEDGRPQGDYVVKLCFLAPTSSLGVDTSWLCCESKCAAAVDAAAGVVCMQCLRLCDGQLGRSVMAYGRTHTTNSKRVVVMIRGLLLDFAGLWLTSWPIGKLYVNIWGHPTGRASITRARYARRPQHHCTATGDFFSRITSTLGYSWRGCDMMGRGWVRSSSPVAATGSWAPDRRSGSPDRIAKTRHQLGSVYKPTVEVSHKQLP